MFDFLVSCILIVYDNYVTTGENVTPNQQFHYN
jgi:hypothetical protein